MNNGFTRVQYLAEGDDGSRALGTWTYQGDPGNRFTVMSLCESALLLATDRESLPGGAERGGILTPATALGMPVTPPSAAYGTPAMATAVEALLLAAGQADGLFSMGGHEDGIVAALEAGVASIEHGSYTGDRAIPLFLETGAYLVPTLLAGKTVAAIAVESDILTPAMAEKAVRVGSDMAGSFAKAHKAGVNIAYGTDSGISPHGTNAEEAVLMVEAGMAEMDVIVSATINAADLIDMSDSLGTIEAGKYADIIAVDRSPLDDIAELLDVDFVMKSGKVYKD